MGTIKKASLKVQTRRFQFCNTQSSILNVGEKSERLWSGDESRLLRESEHDCSDPRAPCLVNIGVLVLSRCGKHRRL